MHLFSKPDCLGQEAHTLEACDSHRLWDVFCPNLNLPGICPSHDSQY